MVNLFPPPTLGISICTEVYRRRKTAEKMDQSRRFSENELREHDSLGLGESSYIVKTGNADYDAQAFPGRIWHLWVIGSYYSFSGDYNRNAPKVKLAVTNAIRAIYHRVIELERR